MSGQVKFQDAIGGAREYPDGLVFRGEHMNDAAYVPPLIEIVSVFVEDLDTPVVAIGDVDVTLSVDGHAVRHLELARTGTVGPPCHHVLAVLVELHNARVEISIGHEGGSVRKKSYVRGQ